MYLSFFVIGSTLLSLFIKFNFLSLSEVDCFGIYASLFLLCYHNEKNYRSPFYVYLSSADSDLGPKGSLESSLIGYSFGKESFEATNAISCFLSTVENICLSSVIRYLPVIYSSFSLSWTRPVTGICKLITSF